MARLLLVHLYVIPISLFLPQEAGCVLIADELANELTFDPGGVFNETLSIVADNFYDPEFDFDLWRQSLEGDFQRAAMAKTRVEFSEIMSEVLGTLNSSHTAYLSRLDPKRYQLLGIFHSMFADSAEAEFLYAGIGLDTRDDAGTHVVVSVFDGFAAQKADIQFGDRILTVDGQPFHPILSFANCAGQDVTIRLRRGSRILDVRTTVEWIDGRQMFELAMDASVRKIRLDEGTIGYVHLWSYAGTVFQEKLRSLLLWGELSQCDGVVLDLRDGWGGADINNLNLFRAPIARIESTSRSLGKQNYTGVWNKPVAIVANERSTSGKELFTYGFKKLDLGKVVGTRTAGAVLGGRPFMLSNGDVVYVAVADVLVDGQRLEGQGVEPDVDVPRSYNESTTEDPQLDAAVKILQTEISATLGPRGS